MAATPSLTFAAMDNPPLRSVNSTVRDAMTRRLHRRSIVEGKITLPAVPGMIDQYMAMCEALFTTVGRPFTPEQLGQVRAVLEGQLAAAYQNSPRSNIVISFDAPVGMILNYRVKAEWWTVDGAYENWIDTREPPLFGTEPDARVWMLANQATDPTAHRVLDIDGGTGRNTLALARRGHPVDVVEMTPKFAGMIRADAERESLNVRVIERDVFATEDDLAARLSADPALRGGIRFPHGAAVACRIRTCHAVLGRRWTSGVQCVPREARLHAR